MFSARSVGPFPVLGGLGNYGPAARRGGGLWCLVALRVGGDGPPHALAPVGRGTQHVLPSGSTFLPTGAAPRATAAPAGPRTVAQAQGHGNDVGTTLGRADGVLAALAWVAGPDPAPTDQPRPLQRRRAGPLRRRVRHHRVHARPALHPQPPRARLHHRRTRRPWPGSPVTPTLCPSNSSIRPGGASRTVGDRATTGLVVVASCRWFAVHRCGRRCHKPRPVPNTAYRAHPALAHPSAARPSRAVAATRSRSDAAVGSRRDAR